MRYNAGIQGLRGISVLLVVLYHFQIPFLKGGFIGVDVFFVISGYLIAKNIRSEILTNNFSLSLFYYNRIKRLLPSLYFILILSSVIFYFLLQPTLFREYAKSIVSTLLSFSNIFFWLNSGYFDRDVVFKPLIHTWSLSVEEQFYFIFPIFYWVLIKKINKNVLQILFILLLISLCFSQFISIKMPAANFYLLPSRIWEFMVGVVCSYVNVKLAPRSHSLKIICILLLCILLSAFFFDETLPLPGFYSVIPVFSAGILLIYLEREDFLLLNNQVLVFFGSISYSLYLWHQPIIAALNNIFTNTTPLDQLLGFIVSVALSFITWRYVENTFRFKIQNHRLILYCLVLSSTLLLTFAAASLYSNAFSSLKYSENQLSLFNTIKHSPYRDKCQDASPFRACVFGTTPTIAVIGDSHATELAYSLFSHLPPGHSGVVQYSKGGCKPSFASISPINDDCSVWSRDVLQSVISNKEISKVVIFYRLNYHLFGEHIKTYPEFPNKFTDGTRNFIIHSLMYLFEELHKSGKEVFFIFPAPELPMNIEDIISHSYASNSLLGTSAQWYDKRNQYLVGPANLLKPA